MSDIQDKPALPEQRTQPATQEAPVAAKATWLSHARHHALTAAVVLGALLVGVKLSGVHIALPWSSHSAVPAFDAPNLGQITGVVVIDSERVANDAVNVMDTPANKAIWYAHGAQVGAIVGATVNQAAQYYKSRGYLVLDGNKYVLAYPSSIDATAAVSQNMLSALQQALDQWKQTPPETRPQQFPADPQTYSTPASQPQAAQPDAAPSLPPGYVPSDSTN